MKKLSEHKEMGKWQLKRSHRTGGPRTRSLLTPVDNLRQFEGVRILFMKNRGKSMSRQEKWLIFSLSRSYLM